MTVFLISTFAAIIISFLCSLTEAVLLSLNNLKIETDKNNGKSYAITLTGLKKHINRPISAILILNTIAHTGGATVAGSAFDEIYGEEWIWLFSLIFTIVILFVTEIFPKVYGVSNTEKLSVIIASPLKWITTILYPVIFVTEKFSNLFVKKKGKTNQFSLEDIHTIARVAQGENVINKDQENIIVRTSTLRSRRVEEIILPMDKVILFRKNEPFQRYFQLAKEHLHTRYPVSASDSPQDIIGYLNIKELALQGKEYESNSLEKLIRPILFVSLDTNLLQLLRKLNSSRYHLAIVRDNQGNNIGMVTLEDIVEEIVGELVDEFDME